MLSVVSVYLPGPNVSPNCAEVDELRGLRLAHDELRAVLDLLVLVGEAERQRVARVVGPLDDVDELFLDEIDDRHRRLRGSVVGSAARTALDFLRRRELLRARPRAVLSSVSICASGSAPGIIEPSAKTASASR